MKKSLLIITIALGAYGISQAQNVGVDVATPVQKLDVAGGLKIANTSNGVAGSIRWNGTNFQVHDGSQWINFGAGTDHDWAITGNDMYSEVSGNVGIGTSTPAAKLQVAGTAQVAALNVNGNYTLPTVDGTAGYVLGTDGFGNVSWTNPALVGDITSVIAGAGLINGGVTGDVTLDVNPGDGIQIVSDEVRVKASDLSGSGITVTSNNFDVNVDNSTVEVNSGTNQLQVKAEGITANEIATGAVATDEILNGTILTGDISTGGVTTANILDGTILPADIYSVGNSLVLTTDATGTVQWQSQGSLSSSQQGDGLVYDAPNAEIDVNPGDGIEVVSDQVKVKSTDLNGSGLAVSSNNLDVNVDNSTLDVNTVTNEVRVKAGGITTSHILDGTILTSDISTGGVTTTNILDGTILGADIDPSATVNQVLATTVANTTVAWVDPATLNTVLQDNDTDTKIQVEESADEDKIRFDTFGSERMIIDKTGNVGIGTTVPVRNLQVADPAGASLLLMHSGGNNTALGTMTGQLLFDSDDDSAPSSSDVDASAVIRGYVSETVNGHGGSNKGGDLAFLTKANGTAATAAATERMRITNRGNVGIGTTSPDYKLQIDGHTVPEVDNSYDLGTSTLRWRNIYASSLAAGNLTQGSVVFAGASGALTQDNPNLFFNNTTNNFGIGTDAPVSPLHIQSNASGYGQLKIKRATTTVGEASIGFFEASNTANIAAWVVGTGGWGNTSDFVIGKNGVRLLIESSGNVGIGTTGPSTKLDVSGNIKATGVVYWGNSLTRTETLNDAGLQGNAGARSGFFEASAPSPGADWYPGASSWQHLLSIRHNNPVNNYSMQFAGSFFDQNLWFRKTNNNPAQAWSRILTTNDFSTLSGVTNYLARWTSATALGTGTTYDNGTNVGIGTASPAQKLHVIGNTRISGLAGSGNRVVQANASGDLIISNDLPGGDASYIWNQTAADQAAGFRISGNGFVGGNLGVGTTAVNDRMTVNGWIGRTAHNNGALVGSYNNVGANSAMTNPIYTIGTSYKPAASTLGNMYGIGYSHTAASFITDPGPDSWGMYVAADGVARNFIAASSGGSSYFNAGNVGIGTSTPYQKLDVIGTGRFTSALTLEGQTDNADGQDRAAYWNYDNKVGLVMKPAANDGATAILFPSIGNAPSDFAYIAYDEDYGEAGVAAGENGALILGAENDGTGSSDHVRVKSRLVVEADMSSSDPTAAFEVKSGNVTADLLTVRRSGNVGIGTTTPTFKLHVPSGNIGTDYLNTTDNSVGSGVTGVMIKAGDNYLRTGTANAVATFLNGTTTGPWIPNNGIGDWQIASSSTSTAYTAATLELRESNFTGNGSATPPHLGFHWGGVVASNIAIESSGRIAIRNNPGTGYEHFIANNIYATGTMYPGNSSTYINASEFHHPNGRIMLSGNLHIDSYNGNDIYMNYYSNRNTRIYSGSGILTAFFSTTGNVGIGTTGPSEKLHVSGNARITGLSGTGNRPVYADASGVLRTGSAASYAVASNLAYSFDDVNWTNAISCDDCISGAVNIGFTMRVFGTNYTQVQLSSNGVVTFGGSGGSSSLSNTCLPSSIFGMAALMFMWDDLIASDFRYRTVGTAPNRVFQARYNGYHFNNSGYQVDCMIMMHEGSNLIVVRYDDLGCCGDDPKGSGATIGLQGPGGASAKAIPIGCNAALGDDNQGPNASQFISFRAPD